MAAHVFIDNSNVFGGARRAAETLEPTPVGRAVRVYYRNLFRLVEGGHHIITRVMAGSVPPGNDDLWEYSRSAGYDTDLLRRVQREDGHLSEQAVDELLHLKIANALLDFDPPQVLVLVTGDGGAGDYGTSFVRQAERAFRRGWDVEIWSWSAQLSGRFGRIPYPSGRTLRVRELDPHYRRLTFIKGGTYRVGDTEITLAERVVAPWR